MNLNFLAYDQQGAVARVWLNRPELRNAQSRELLQELDDVLQVVARDETVNVVVLAGKGDHFSAGHDLKQGQRERSNFTVEQRWEYEDRYYFDYCLRVWDMPKPVIAQVQGACVAGGFMLANMCDLIVASEDAFFSDPVCATFGTAATEVLMHPWVLGTRRAKEFLYTGMRMPAKQAWEMGMVNRVVPRAELEERTMELAQQIAGAPPFAIRLTKRSINRAADMQGFRTSLQAHFDTHQLSHNSLEFARVRDAGMSNVIAANKARK
jgi:enoyl-CoA hydratase